MSIRSNSETGTGTWHEHPSKSPIAQKDSGPKFGPLSALKNPYGFPVS